MNRAALRMLPENRVADEAEAFLAAMADEKRQEEEDAALVQSAQRVRQAIEYVIFSGAKVLASHLLLLPKFRAPCPGYSRWPNSCAFGALTNKL